MILNHIISGLVFALVGHFISCGILEARESCKASVTSSLRCTSSPQVSQWISVTSSWFQAYQSTSDFKCLKKFEENFELWSILNQESEQTFVN